jgi:hypothetical protein
MVGCYSFISGAGAIYLLAKRAVRLSDSERARLFDSKGATKLL